MLAIKKIMYECPNCHSRYFRETLTPTLGVRNGYLVQIHPICIKCFSECSQGHKLDYGDCCRQCGELRRRFNLQARELDPNDPTFGLTSTGSQSYPETETKLYAGTQTSGSNGTIYCNSFVAPAGGATIVALELEYSTAGDTSKHFVIGIYDDVGGVPVNPLASVVRTVTGTGSLKVTLATPLFLESSTTYSIGVQNESTANVFKYNNAGSSREKAHTYDGTLPTLSGTSSGTSGINVGRFHVLIKGYAKATKAILSDNNAAIDLMSFYAHDTGNFRISIFSDSSGPNTKQWESGSVTVTVAPAWQPVNISDGTPTSLVLPSGTFWFPWQVDTANKVPSYTAGSSGDGNYRTMSYGSFPATWTSGTSTAEKWSIYASYTPATAITVTDSGAGTDSVANIEKVTKDSGAGVEVLTIGAQPTFTDSGVGSESPSISATLYVADSGFGTDLNLTRAVPTFTDSGMGIDIAYRVRGEISIDGISLPHVLEINIVDKTNLDTRPVTGKLPHREWLGNAGRTFTVSGWTRSLTDVDQLKTFCNGQPHVLILPSGDGLRVLVRDVHPDKASEDYDYVRYALTCVETVD